MELRKVYAETMAELMKKNDKIVILDADLSKAGGTAPLYKAFPDRTYDVGICESNMTSMAAGLSAYGFIPVIHSFAPFVTRRNFDQIAVSVSYARRNVKIIGLDPGITATLNGGTHMCFEDIASLRSLPNVLIFDAVDGVQLKKALPKLMEHDGPTYIRLFRKDGTEFFEADNYNFELFKADKLTEGNDVTIVAEGMLTVDAMRAVNELTKSGIDAELISVHTIKPLDEQTILQSARKTRAVLTVENGSVHGGLYGAVTELLSRECPTLCDAIAVYDIDGQVGELDELKGFYHMTTEDIVAKAKSLATKKSHR